MTLKVSHLSQSVCDPFRVDVHLNLIPVVSLRSTTG